MPFKFNPFTGNLDEAEAGTGTGDMLGANNLSDVVDVSASRDNLGLGTLATQDGTFSGISSGTNTGDQVLPIKASGAELDTGTDDAKFATPKALADSAYAKTTDITAAAVGLGNVDNTSDANKPVSTATQTALDLKQNSLGFTPADDSAVVHDTGDETIAGVKTFSSDPLIPDEAYGVGWNGSLEPPTKNAVYDKVETLSAGGIGGSTGATDNAILRADGAGGATAQGSNLTVSDDGAAINVAAFGAAGSIGITLTPKANGEYLIATHSMALNGGYIRFGYNFGSQFEIANDTYISKLTAGSAGLIGFGTNNGTANMDAAFGRNAAGKVEVNSGSLGTLRDLIVRQHYIDQTITPGGTTGNVTINKAAGTVNIAASGTAVTVTCDRCTTSSSVLAVIRTNDSTATIKNVVPSNGSFVITLGAAATAEVSIFFIVLN